MSESIKIHYIIGIGRSGTSLLMSLLGSQPVIHTPPENYFSVFFERSFSNKTTFSAREIELIHKFNLAFGKLQPYVGFDYQLPDSLLKNGFQGTYFQLCKIIYSSFKHVSFPEKNPSIFIDKNPSNTLFLNRIKRFNPEAKYILMVRDYRGNILSRKESIHLLSPNIAFNAIRWNYFTMKALIWKNKYPNHVFIVRYEDLVNNTDVSLKNIFSFLEVDPIFSEDLRSKEREGYEKYKEDATIAKSTRAKKKYEDLSKPIFKHRVDEWKDKLSPSEQLTAAVFCKETASNFNYFTCQRISFSKRFSIRFRYAFLMIKIRLVFIKDYFFHFLPIEFKVRRFENYVESINKKRGLKK